MIVRKTDGGYLYATTDLAAARWRIEQLRADRLIYVTDARQSQHFAMVFATLRASGWATDRVQLEHVPFGTVLGEDQKPFKTRSGEVVKLLELLDEAEQRAEAIINQKNPQLPQDQRRVIAHAVGIGALKYADLASDRIKDYVFSWDRMLAFDGNTAPYLQNAYVRIRSIFRKGGVDPAALDRRAIAVRDPAERALALQLLLFAPTVEAVGRTLEPHRLCTYLYDLANLFHKFYEGCPVLGAQDASVRESRLVLCDLVARVLERGLGLLGIRVIEQM
jgi:arginyl-tRNA synthetase